jgi:plasmid stability protein
MTKSVTIRDVPEEAHRELASRAALAGQSLQEYLRSQLVEMASRPDNRALVDRIRARVERTQSHLSPEKILEYRDAGRR